MEFYFDLQRFAGLSIDVSKDALKDKTAYVGTGGVGKADNPQWANRQHNPYNAGTSAAGGTSTVWAMYDAGKSVLTVASKVGEPNSGEINAVNTENYSGSISVTFGSYGTADYNDDGGLGNVPAMEAYAGTLTVNGVVFESGATTIGTMTYTNKTMTGVSGDVTAFVKGQTSTDSLELKGLTGSMSFGQAGTGGTFTNVTGSVNFDNSNGGVYTLKMEDKSGQKFVGTTGAAWSVEGGAKDDFVIVGADTLSGTVVAGAGNDTIGIAGTKSYVDGGDGNDLILTNTATEITINGGAGKDSIGGVGGFSDTMSFGTSSGFAGSKSLIDAGEGDDVIAVGGTENTVIGGAGKDTIYAIGAGKNTLTGGADADVFDLTQVGADGVVAITDYAFGEDVVKVNDATAIGLANAVGTFTASGLAYVTGAGVGTANFNPEGNGASFYAVTLQGKDNAKQVVAWVGENATTVDGSSFNKVVLQGYQNDDAGDLLLGGAGADTIWAGKNDSVVAGAGNDEIYLMGKASDGTYKAGTGYGAQIALSTSTGRDTVHGYVGGFDLEKGNGIQVTDFQSLDTIGFTTSVSGGVGTVTVTDGSTSNSLTLAGVGTGSSGAYELLVNGAKVAVADANKTVTVASADYADVYVGATNKTSVLDFGNVDDSLLINLADTNKYKNIVKVKGGKADTTIMGSSAKDTITASGGNTTLWGGAGNDNIVGATVTSAKNTFVLAAGDGNDTITGFKAYTDATEDTADVLYLYGGASLKGISRSSSNKFTISLEGGETAAYTTTTSNGANDIVQFTTDGSKIGRAKIGMDKSTNNFTYESSVTNYLGGTVKDTVSLKAGDSDDHKIWLDGSQGVSYSSIDIIDATGATGNNQLAGDSLSQTIKGGSGNDSLWGGAGSESDTLVSGKGDSTLFYLKGNGNDVMSGVKNTDLVNLLDVSLEDLKSYDFTSSQLNVVFNNGETLTIKKNSSASTVTVALADGSKWTGNYSTKTWTKA